MEDAKTTVELTSDEVMTSEEAFTFVHEVLEVTSPKEKMASDPVAFLHEILYSWQANMPFQTVHSIATPKKDRHRPTLLEVKNDILVKLGGRCYHNNVGCYMVMKALGYQVSLVPANTVSIKSTHAVIMVYNLSGEGSKHLADMGTGGWPTFQPIPLDFEKESPEYHESFLIYKFVRQGDVIVRLHNVESDPAGANFYKASFKDEWYTYASIRFNTPVAVSHFDNVMTRLYTQVNDDLPLLSKLLCIAFPKGRFLSINNTTLLEEQENGWVKKTYLRSRDEIIDVFKRHFPHFDESTIHAAMDDEFVKLDFSKGLPTA
ncbi:uncharacterized protein [Diadema antillarum]|uniref:uncharacterized protein n=1 Tax=Diadema antillarum TaxID=105358 RepID=UPI003A85BD93